MFKVGVGDKHEVDALHHLAERLQQRRVELYVPPTVQQNRHAADLSYDDEPSPSPSQSGRDGFLDGLGLGVGRGLRGGGGRACAIYAQSVKITPGESPY